MPTSETLSEVFRFISVKDATNGLATTNLPNNFIVFENVYEAIVLANPAIGNDNFTLTYNEQTFTDTNYYKLLKTAVENNESLATIIGIMLTFRVSLPHYHYINDAKTLYELFPNFDRIEDYINREYDTVSANVARETLLVMLGSTASDFKSGTNRWVYYFWVWESIMAHIIAPETGDQKIREQLISAIKIWELMSAWDSAYSGTPLLKDVMPWYNLYVVLPKELPLPLEYTPTLEANDPPNGSDNTTLLANIETYKAAIKKLNKTLTKQLGEYKNEQQDLTITVVNPSSPFSPVTNSPFLLNPANITVLGSNIVTILTNNGMNANYIDVAHGMAFFANEL